MLGPQKLVVCPRVGNSLQETSIFYGRMANWDESVGVMRLLCENIVSVVILSPRHMAQMCVSNEGTLVSARTALLRR